MENNNTKLEEIIVEETLIPGENPVIIEEIKIEPVAKGKAFWMKLKNFITGHLKIVVAIITVVVILVLVYVFKGQFIAASVNGTLISRHAVVAELEKVSGKNALDSIITEKLIKDEAKNKNVTVSAEEVAAEITKVEDQVKAQGGTLETALTAQGMTRAIFEKQVLIQKMLEKLLADKIGVTDTEIAQYLKDNKITVPAGQEATYNAQVKNQIQQQKMSSEAGALIASLRAAAKIKYFVTY
jgi:hypothetical protein